MSVWLEKKYINMLSPQLKNFRWFGNNARCSCPVCGDSKTNASKARFYFLQKNNKYGVYCHNCHVSGPFQNFLKNKDAQLYEEFYRELLLEKIEMKVEDTSQFVTNTATRIINEVTLSGIDKITTLDEEHPIRKYVDDRKIPLEQQERLYYTNDFNGWVNSILPDKLPDFKEARLVIPLFDEAGKMFAFQGRALNPNSKQRYITIYIDETKPKIYGLDIVDRSKKHYVVEGPLDSLFLPNCIAMAGSDIPYSELNEHSIMIYDNQPRNKQVIQKIKKAIEKKLSVVIWPKNIKAKDINDMVREGMTSGEVLKVVENHTYNYLQAELKLLEWKEV